MNKRLRQQLILDIINEVDAGTQDELAEELKARGISVTQATLSRDIRDLNLIKVSGRYKKHRYSADKSSGAHDKKFLNLFINCVMSVETAQNIVVVKTLGGNGNCAGVVVDGLGLSEVVGSVAGDDTLIIVTRNNYDAEKVCNKLKAIVNDN